MGQEKIDNQTMQKEILTGTVGVEVQVEPMPQDFFKPMLATLADEAFDDIEWQYEIKWDGYRAISFIKPGSINIISRNDKSYNEKFFPLYQIMKSWEFTAVLDGEVIVINNEGSSDFSALQNWRSEADGKLVYCVFDILSFRGENLMGLPLIERRKLLSKVLLINNDQIRLSEALQSSGIESFILAEKNQQEGIIAKRLNSLYYSGKRSREWLKIKVKKRQEVVIGGYTIQKNTPRLFSSLLLGVYEKGTLLYVGKVGTGFSERTQKEIMLQFVPLISEINPFKSVDEIYEANGHRNDISDNGIVWLRPELVCEVAFAEITKEGLFRHPSFKGMRVDKEASAVTREMEEVTSDILKNIFSPK